jgi:ubiquitin-protein ligase
MLSPRIRRLKLDYDILMQRFANWPLIQVSGTAGMPPEVYRISYQIKGLYVSPTGEILERDTHQLEVNLSLGYPRRAPQCRMLAPVFHPNFDEGSVCIGDFWAASEGLDDLIVRIGRMIAYQEYNTKSPLNGLAAKWAAQNASLLPIDTRNIAPPSGAAEEASLPGDAPKVSQAENAPADLSGDPWSQKISLG